MTNSWQSANDGTKYPKYTVQSDYDYQYRNHMRWDNQIGSSEKWVPTIACILVREITWHSEKCL